MAEQPVPTQPALQAVSRPRLLWLAIILAAILGGSAYFLYAQQQTPPSLTTQQGKSNQGFVSSTPTPKATPTLTSTDSVADIEKDLSGTTIEAGNSSEFTVDLQSL